MGFTDLSYLFSGRSKQEDGELALHFVGNGAEIVVKIVFAATGQKFLLDCLLNGSSVGGQDADNARRILNAVYAFQAQFVPPIGTVSPEERVLTWQELQAELAEGKHAEAWRNQLHWLNEGQQPEVFQRVAEHIRMYMPDVQ